MAEHPQLPQPLLSRLTLQTPHQLRCPSLDPPQPLNVFFVGACSVMMKRSLLRKRAKNFVTACSHMEIKTKFGYLFSSRSVSELEQDKAK
ncbi:hypothetical protein llap_5399 [Limosa lapponica baueri]|uniref:Uncharacterized protein n=1 Tax=Limosa lapponica baueri TaxID=1758121 RepID=A0A2I0UE27_LIMLA|nr:hypothetical protein llap_5399 [Limosa lapponica baueri]